MIVPNVSDELITSLERTAEFIGNTPLYPIRNAFQKPGVKIFAKLEWYQLSNSVKARAGFHIIKDAILSGQLYPGRHILDSSSGNTGIAYAAIGASLGIPVTLFVPGKASKERVTILRSLGVNLIVTHESTTGDQLQEMALDLYNQYPDKYFYANQYANDSNWKAHYSSTAEEIIQQTGGDITHFAAGMGTTGTFIGIGRRLREFDPTIQLISMQPDASDHSIDGWKHLPTTSLTPKIYAPNLADENLIVSTKEAYEWIRRFARTEGILLSPSAGAAMAGAVKLAERIDQGTIVTIFADSADKYGEVINSVFKNQEDNF